MARWEFSAIASGGMPKFSLADEIPRQREARPRRKRRGRDDHSVKSVLFSFGVMEVERGLRSGVVMMFGLLVVAVREVSVMAGLLMVTFFVMVLRFAMMLGGLFVVLGGLSMMFGGGFRMFHGGVSSRARIVKSALAPSWRLPVTPK